MSRALPVLLLLALSGVHAVQAAAPEPRVQRTVLEDDGARIEELRVRGIIQRLVVRPKAASAPEYEILPPDPGRDTPQDRRAAGQRVWRLFSF
jgi:hypothetical protein